MWRILIIPVFLTMILAGHALHGQAIGDYRTDIVGSENWSSLAAWERLNSTGPDVWATPTPGQGYPGENSSPGTVTMEDAGTLTLDVSPANAIINLVIGGSPGIFNVSGNQNIIITNFAINFNCSFTFGGTGNLTVNGTSTVDGTFTDDNNTGTTRFVGAVSVGGSGTFSSASVTTAANMNFRGGINNSNSFTAGGATFNTNNQSISGNADLQFNNDVAIDAITLTVTNIQDLNVSGSTTLSGTGGFTDSDNGGITTFGGNVSIAASGTFLSTVVATTGNMVFQGGIDNNGSFTAGGATFNINSQNITGTADLQFNNNVSIDVITLTVTNSGDLSVSGSTRLAGTGSFTDSNNGGVTTFGGNLNIVANGTFLSTAVSTTGNMVFQGGITNTAGIFSAGGATFNTNTQSLAGASDISFANNIAIIGRRLTNNNTANFTVTGTTTVTNAGLRDNNAAGINTFIGAYSQSGTSSFNTTSVTNPANLIFRGGITSSGTTFTAGGATFDTNNQALAGAGALSFANTVEVIVVTVTNNSTGGVTISNSAAGSLQGSGTWTQGNNSSLTYSGSTITVTNFNASNTGNTVDYNSASVGQAVIGTTYHHLTLSGTGNQTKTLAANALLGGNLSILNSASFSVGTFSLSVAGNWDNTSTNADPFVEGTQTVTFNGAGTQTLTATSGETFHSLIINTGAANTVQLQNDVTVMQTLTLTQGGVDLNQNNLNIASNSIAAIVRTNGYVRSETTPTPGYSTVVRAIGTATGSFVFPFGTASGVANYIPFTFEVTSAGVGATGSIAIATYHTALDNTPYPTGVTHVQDALGNDNSANTVDRFWLIVPVNYTTAPTSTMTFSATAADLSGITSFTGAQRWDGVNWELPLPGQTNTATTATVPGVTTYSPWAVSGNGSPLPVELTAFAAIAQQDRVKLTWSTASELNNDHFTIERSGDGEAFGQVLQIEGNGTTIERSDYEAFDFLPQNGRSYYRLKQTDFDGTHSFSKIVTVDVAGLNRFETYPNPVSNGAELTIELGSLEAGQMIQMRMIDAKGVVRFQHMAEADAQGFVRSVIATSQLPKGAYIVIVNGNNYLARRVVID